MNVVEFRRVKAAEPGWVNAIDVFIDGTRLKDLATPVERPYADAEGHPNLAGDYGPLYFSSNEEARRQYLGEPVYIWHGDGDTVLLGCPGCGEWGCWPMTAIVTVNADTVSWDRFRTGHRRWDLSGLGPFVFDRAQYVQAVLLVTD